MLCWSLHELFSKKKVVYQGKYLESKQVVYQVGLIPMRSYTEVPVYIKRIVIYLNFQYTLLKVDMMENIVHTIFSSDANEVVVCSSS